MEPADLVMVNGVVRTMDPTGPPVADAIAARAGRIVAVGHEADIEPLVGPQTTVLDCRGDTVLPGFVDGHCHFEMTCLALDHGIKAQTPPYASLSEVRAVIERELEVVAPGDDWVICRSSFDMHVKVAEGRLFSRLELDELCADRPVVVFASLHVSSLNTLAFQRLGLWEPASEHREHGYVHRDEHGIPTGPVTEIFLLLPELWTGDAFRRAVTGHGRDLFNAAGTTTVHTMPESLGQVAELRDLQARGQMTVRQRYYLIHPAVASLDEIVELSAGDRDSDWFTFGGMKVFVNGCAHDGLGHQIDDSKWTQDELDQLVGHAHANGIQVWLHSLDANGVRMAARSIERAYSSDPRPLRHRIEHGGDFIALEDVEAVRRSGALLVTTPQFVRSMTRGVDERFAPLRTLHDAGFHLVGGTDSTGTVPESVSILGNIGTAVTRRTAGGSVVGADQALDVASAVGLFTTGSSFGGFEENRKGALRPGMLADMVQLAADPWSVPPDEIASVEVVRTIVGGELVFPGED
jgi:predicted amidohydrolase YtcJ